MKIIDRRVRKLEGILAPQEEGPSLAEIIRAGRWPRIAGGQPLQIDSAGMTPEGPQDITGLLAAWSEGNEEALSRLIPMVYPELRRIARLHLARRDDTLESAALVHEAYLKLIRARGIQCENRLHFFFALCTQIIRRILVDHARKRRYAKRGGNQVRVPWEEGLASLAACGNSKFRPGKRFSSDFGGYLHVQPCCGKAL
jgi:hypothetical protein